MFIQFLLFCVLPLLTILYTHCYHIFHNIFIDFISALFNYFAWWYLFWFDTLVCNLVPSCFLPPLYMTIYQIIHISPHQPKQLPGAGTVASGIARIFSHVGFWGSWWSFREGAESFPPAVQPKTSPNSLPCSRESLPAPPAWRSQ